MSERRHILVCYDICDPKRLRRVHKTVRNFGQSVQYSVFACRLTRLARADLEARLLEEIDAGVDQVMLVDLGPAGSGDEYVPGSRVLGHVGRRRWASVIVV